MKKLLIILHIVLSSSLTLASDKWTGPTSSIDPMWGMKGSSIMAESLRDNPLPNPLLDSTNDDKVKEAYEQGKRDGQKGSGLLSPIGVD